MADWIEVLFEVVDRVDQAYHVLDGGPELRILLTGTGKLFFGVGEWGGVM